MADMETIARLLSQTWPGRAVQSAITGLKAPGNAYASTPENPVTTEQMIAPAADLAGLMVGSPGGVGGLGSGLRGKITPFENQISQFREKNGLPPATPSSIAENIRSRIRQIEYDRRLSKVPGEEYPAHGELSMLRARLKDFEGL